MRLVLFFSILLSYLNISANQNRELPDTCICCNKMSLKEELISILKKYNVIAKYNDTIYEVNYKKENDSTNIYIVTITNTVVTLLQKIPSFYAIFDTSLVYIYTENVCKKTLPGSCLNKLFYVSLTYSYDIIEEISWSEYKFRFKKKSFDFPDDIPIILFEVKKGKITSAKPINFLLYKKDMNPIFIN